MAKLALPFPIPKEWGPSTAQAIEDNLQRIYGSSGRLGSGGGSTFVNGLDLIVPSPGDMIVCTTSGIFVALSLVSTAQRVLTNNGGTPTWALVDLSDGITGVLPYANFTNATVTQRILGRNSGGSGVWEEVTATQLLDWLGAVQGDILYRNGTTWVPLAPGTAGQFLQTGGAAANPSWGTPTGGGSIADFIQQNFIFASGRLIANPIPWGHIGPTAIVAPTAASDSQGTWQQYSQSGTTINLRAGFDSGQRTLFRADNDPTLEFVVKTGATMANIRIYALMSDTATSGSADDLGGTSKYMGFRYSTVAGDGGWVGVTRDGTTQSVTATVAAIAASTMYKLKIRKSGSSVFFSVNGGAETSTSSNLPAAATEFGIDLMASNAAGGSTHPILFSRYRCYYGS